MEGRPRDGKPGKCRRHRVQGHALACDPDALRSTGFSGHGNRTDKWAGAGDCGQDTATRHPRRAYAGLWAHLLGDSPRSLTNKPSGGGSGAHHSQMGMVWINHELSEDKDKI